MITFEDVILLTTLVPILLFKLQVKQNELNIIINKQTKTKMSYYLEPV